MRQLHRFLHSLSRLIEILRDSLIELEGRRMEFVFQQLRRLSGEFSSVRLFPPADAKLMFRSSGRLPGELDPHLRRFFGYSNGATVLDYCVVGCKNRSLLDLADNTLSLWPLNNWLAGEFVGFVTNSVGENFGYLRRVEGDQGSHPVAYLRRPEDRFLFVVASSVERFFGNFVGDVADTLTRNPAALGVDSDGWPCDLSAWLTRDQALGDMYSSGVLSTFVENHPELDSIIRAPLAREW